MLNIVNQQPIIADGLFLCKREGLNHRQVSFGDVIIKSGERFTIEDAVTPSIKMPRGAVKTKEAGLVNPMALNLEWKLINPQQQ